MFFSKSGIVAAAMLGVSAVQGHMVMRQPTPYSASTLNNSPLAADGSDFPCKLRPNAFEAPAEETIIQIGQSMPLIFTGSAVHGGGSCQVSLTTDLEPTKESKWVVIKSFEGGCPANTDGNLPGGPDSPDPFEFDYAIPAGIEPGKYTLAWTWFNRVGNREMYMNCAPITVTSGSSKREAAPVQEVEVEKRSANFPAMFIANINGCNTPEGVDIRFPNPGENMQYLGNAKNLQAPGSAACNGVPSWTVEGGSASPATSSSPSATSVGGGVSISVGLSIGATAAPTAVPESEPTGAEAGPGVFAPTSVTVIPQPEITASPSSSGSESGSESSSGSGSVSSPPPTTSVSPSTPGSSGALTGACNLEGLWNCIGGTAFQRCANGQWSETQQMAAGTECTAGQHEDFAITATALKPRMINAMRHRRRAHGSHHH